MCYNNLIKGKGIDVMRKAILDENGRVVDLVKVEEEKSKAYQEFVEKQRRAFAEKYNLPIKRVDK